MIKKLPKVRGNYFYNYPLFPLTWFKVGGNAEIFFKPYNLEDLVYFLSNLSSDIPVTIIGAGSNLLISDNGISGVVIKLGKGFNYIDLQDNHIKVGAGVLNSNLSQFCLQNSIEGFEFLSGIPGNIGGGVSMNAGAHGKEFKDVIHKVIAIDMNGKYLELSPENLNFSYRKCGAADGLIFVEAILDYQFGDKEEIAQKISDIKSTREKTQPIYEKTCGCTFANPTGLSAWKLIDEVGLRGKRINGAQISTLHSNFMINLGNAKAADLYNLGSLVREEVHKKKDILLKWEIKCLGF